MFFNLTLNYAFMAFVAIFLAMISVFLKLNLVESGRRANEHLDTSGMEKYS
ncbi:MAG: hypothetical protein M1587_09930 [Thaumarchaeota archaeon]|nr:hypothetical protein [Nitrososphaerota archaeon]